MLTEQDRAALAALCQAATDGPWTVAYTPRRITVRHAPGHSAIAIFADWHPTPETLATAHHADAEFCAAARIAIPALLNDLATLHGQVQHLQWRIATLMNTAALLPDSAPDDVQGKGC